MKIRIFIFLLLVTKLGFSQSFHDTQGKLEISNSGQSSYTLPIAMPPSIKDVGPIINLVYVSSQNGGIAGQGWNIDNISNISRISTRQDIDGFRDGVDFDSNDKLSLDGQRLLLKTGVYWSDGSTYETEVQSNTKIELKVSGAINYFIVTAPDGSRSWYGNYGGIDGTDTTAFYIVRFEDANGNFMTYHYSKPFNKSLCITEIRFSANTITNVVPLNKIVFTYKIAQRKEYAFIKGLKLEKSEILDKVEVYTDGLLFKKYQLEHISDNLGYQRVNKISEFNGAGEQSNPVLFQYKATSENVAENVIAYVNSLDLSSSPDMSGDFDGDGRLDFISDNKMYSNLFNGTGKVNDLNFVGTQRQKIVATTIKNNRINQKQSLVYANENLSSIEFKIYNLEANAVVNNYNKIIDLDNSGYCYDYCTELMYDSNGELLVGPEYPASKCTDPTFIKNTNKYIEGDFNGDSVSDVLILGYAQTKTYEVTQNDGTDPYIDHGSEFDPPPNNTTCRWNNFTSDYIQEARLIDLNPNVSNAYNTVGNFTVSSTNLQSLNNGKHFVMDFNSDGKADILIVENNKNYKILTFNQLLSAPWAELEVIGQGVLDTYSPTKQILFGDFNGDGKPDISLPTSDLNGCEGCSSWDIYYSNPNPSGGAYFVKENYNIVEYRPSSGTDYSTQYHSSSYYAMDVNKDGKSDIVRVWTNVFQYDPFFDPKDYDSSWRVSTYINNIGLNGGFTNNYTSPSSHNNNNNSRPIPLASNYKYKGLDSDLLIIRYHSTNSFDKTVTFVDFKKDFSEDNLLQKVIQSNGSIVDEIFYEPMVPSNVLYGLGSPEDFYSSTESLQYPLIELKQLPSNKLVFKLKNTSLGIVKNQDYKYHGLGVNLNGIGVTGFKKTARSSWYRNDTDKKNWNVVENSPLLRGATLKSYSLLLNNGEKFSFGANYSTLLNKTENIFVENIDATTKRYSILLTKQTTTDYLTNIINQKIYNSYSTDFLLPTSVTVNNFLGSVLHGSITSLTNYDSNSGGIGNNYYIGRPTEVNTTKTLFVNTQTGSNNIKTLNEKYFYTNANLTRLEKKSNSSVETLIETSAYFPNGLLESKTISASGTTSANEVSNRTTSYTYDPSNRYIKTTTDPEGSIVTNLSFHSLYGTILTQRNTFSQITTSIYDNWGKRNKVTDFLGKSINYTYTRTGDLYSTLQIGDDGSSSLVESDALARPIKEGRKDINGNWIYKSIEYDYLSRKIKESDPYMSTTSPSLWTTHTYDDYNRPIKLTSPTGKIINTNYNGLTVTTADNVMTKSKTMNANGQVISATDTPGGTILYKFDADNNLVESDYEGVKITVQYDNWGRKIQLVDSSAGTYTTSYNAFGEIKTETTPKGTTMYNLNSVGKLLNKSITGDGTSITSNYSYDPTNKLLTNIAVTNPNDGNSNYEYSYDVTTMQLKKTIENLYTLGTSTPFATFTKEFTFDAFGRVANEVSSASAHGKTSSKTITHTYKNGIEWQLVDGTAMKWQTNSTDNRGQLLTATLGNGITISNTYDNFGYSTQNKHLLGTANVMTLNNSFEPIQANLTYRYNSLFNSSENFSYDSQDRLKTWEGEGQNLITLPFNSTTDGFNFNGDAVYGSVSNSAGTLKVVLNNTDAYANKVLTSNFTKGDKLLIKADITNMVGSSGVMVNVVMVETDPQDPSNFIETPFAAVNNGTLNSNYTVSDYFTNPILSLIFIIDISSPWTSNGGTSTGIDDGSGTITSYQPRTTFYVDNLKIDNVSVNEQKYDDRGRITQNAIGQYNYTINGKPYQNSSVITTAQANSYYTTRALQNISYNALKAPIQIEQQGIDKISFGYNAMQQRSIMYYGNTDNDKFKRPYRKYFSADGSMEIKATFVSGNTTTPTSVEIITYIGGDAYSAPAVVKSDGLTQNYFYLHRDYQGSILAITNSSGVVIEKRLFNPWGEIIKIQDGLGNNLSKLMFFDRGYTGHQHLESVGLIHMNGRLYDPKLHRFLQPDNFVQDPYNTQSFNRYGYCWNNPFKYTDQNGEELITAILIGGAISLGAYFTMALINGTPITLKGALMATFIGAVSGAVTFGIGHWTSTISNFTVKATTQALSHSLFQGTLSGIQGGGFWAGAASGALSSIASSVFSGGQNTAINESTGLREGIGGGWVGAGKFAKNTFGMISFGTIMGGAGAKLTGGNFWKGAVTGLVVSGLNHAMHPGDSYEDVDQEDPEQNSNNQKPNPSEMHSSFKVKKGAVWQNRGGRPSMINSKGEILEWDKQHGEVEKYNPKLAQIKNRHLGGFDPKTGKLRPGSIDPGRRPNRGWNIQSKPISPSIKSVISPKAFFMDAIFGGPVMQMQLEMLKNDYYIQQPTSM